MPYGMDLASYPSMEGKNVLLTGMWQASGLAFSSASMHKHQQQGFATLLIHQCMTDPFTCPTGPWWHARNPAGLPCGVYYTLV